MNWQTVKKQFCDIDNIKNIKCIEIEFKRNSLRQIQSTGPIRIFICAINKNEQDIYQLTLS